MKWSRVKSVILPFLAGVIGLCIGWVDSRPAWDDTGITVGVILIVSAFLGAVARGRPWLVAIAVAAPLSVLEVVLTGNIAVVVSFIPAFVGAYFGAFCGRLF